VDGAFAFFLAICVLFGVAGGLQGRSKGSSFLLWFFIAACLPLFGFLASVVYTGHRHELRRRCDGCGRLLPITDTMCMGCGTDLAFPEVRYRSIAGNVVAVGPDGHALGPAMPAYDDDPTPYERADNPSEQAADAEPDDAPAPAGSGVGPDR
jgi:hypothetical protein